MANPTKLTITSSATLTMIFLMASLVLTFSYDVQANSNSEMESMGTPDLETFATYDEMRRYFASRNLRSLRYLDNPEDDSYIDAFNKHNEQRVELDIDKLRVLKTRPKRSTDQKSLPSEPKLLKFEISDAVEPTDEVKEIIRQHRSRELGNKNKNQTQELSTKTSDPSGTSNNSKAQAQKVNGKSKSNRDSRRMKRASFQQPANFKVKFIPFQIEDAREPDGAMKQHIKRMRALEINQFNEEPKNIPIKIKTKRPLKTVQRIVKLKRSRRDTSSKTQPEMFKFEIEDAKEPDESLKKLFKLQEAREKKQIKETKSTTTTTTPANVIEIKASIISDQGDGDQEEDENMDDDQQTHESRRFYRYKEAPKMKTRKSLNSLPHEVQKVITHLLTEQQEGKACIKYIPAEQMDYGHLKSSYHGQKMLHPVYGTKLKPSGNYAKYVLPVAAQKAAEPLQVHAVPLVEKVQYIYPQTKANAHAQLYQAQTQPIVVPEPVARPLPPVEIHHTYAADLSHVHSQEAIKDIPAPQFRPSKPDPLLDENRLPEEQNQYTTANTTLYPYKIYSYGTAPESYYESEAKPHIHLLGQQQQLDLRKVSAPAQVIKIEYHAPLDSVRENYKELQEFKELSTLIGKSPEDQMHGLTYLLAKEMQRQSKKLAQVGERPQDNTSPILFHPKHADKFRHHHRPSSHIPGRLMALGKGKEYIPIIESTSSGEQTSNINPQSEPIQEAIEEIPTDSHSQEIFEYGGLSPNYDMATAHAVSHVEPKLIVEQVIHHSNAVHHASHEKLVPHVAQDSGEVKLGSGHKLATDAIPLGVHHGEHNEALQYASKYAFGYRIRDFHTGNDFGHKQNRDLDGVTRGQYHILLPDGRIQNVIYHADDTGFHADVSFESGH